MPGLRLEAWDQSRLALPIIAGLVATQVVNTVSTVLVGHLGARDLAAVGLAVSLANVSGYSAPERRWSMSIKG